MVRNRNKKIIFCIVLFCVLIIALLCINSNKNNESISSIENKIKHSNDDAVNTGTTYYISSNGGSSDGTDKNNPMSLNTANSKKYYTGDKILFKGNDIFYGMINFDVKSINTKGYVYIGKYGDGNKPIISGENIVVNKESWQAQDNNIYKLDLSNYDQFVGIGKTYWQPYNIGFLKDSKGKIYGNRKSSIDLLEDEMDFYCEENYLYVKCSSNPYDIYGKISTVSRNNLVNISSNTIIENLIIENTGAHGIVKKESEIKNVTIKNCIIKDIGGCVATSDFVRYGNGIEFWNQAENTNVENCIFENIYDAAYTLQGNTTNTGYINNMCENNIFINSSYAIELFSYNKANEKQTAKMKNTIIQNNIIVNQGRGWGNNNRYDSAIVMMWADKSIPDNSTIYLKNNIYFNFNNLFNTKNTPTYISADKFKKILLSSSNNLFFGNDSHILLGKGVYNDRSLLDEYGQEKNSICKLLTSDDIEKVSNLSITNSEDYDEIKKYYMNFCIMYDDKAIIDELKEKNKIIKENNANMFNNNDISSKYDELIKKLDDYINDFSNNSFEKVNNICDTEIELLKNIIAKYNSGNFNKEDKSKYESAIQNIFDIINMYDKIYNNYVTETQNNSINKDDVADKLNTLINRYDDNIDLDLNFENKLIKNIKSIYDSLLNDEANIQNSYFKKMIINKETDLVSLILENTIKNNSDAEYKLITYSLDKDENVTTNENETITINLPNNKSVITNNNEKNVIEVSKNGIYDFEIKIRGNKYKYSVSINNIDKTKPTINIDSNEKKISIYYENLEKLDVKKDGKNINYTQGDIITTPGIYTITAIDKEKNSIISKKILYDTFNNSNNQEVKYIPINTTETKVKDITENSDFSIERNNRIVPEDSNVATGYKLIENGQEYVLVVKGDITSNRKMWCIRFSKIEKEHCYVNTITK